MNETPKVNTTLTPAAERFIQRMLRFSAGPQAGFKLKVTPGGCSGLASEFDLADKPGAEDVIWEYAGLRIFLDRQSRLLLDGATVDFTERLSHTGFVIATRNAAPQACSQAATFVPVDALVRR